jgi:hypothetical protein
MSITTTSSTKQPVNSPANGFEVFRMNCLAASDASGGEVTAAFEVEPIPDGGWFYHLIDWRATVDSGVDSDMAVFIDGLEWSRTAELGRSAIYLIGDGQPEVIFADVVMFSQNWEPRIYSLGSVVSGTGGINMRFDVNTNGSISVCDLLLARSKNDQPLPSGVDWESLL